MKSWVLGSASTEAVTELAQSLQISPFLAKLLIQRKITTSEEANLFLNAGLRHLPSPFLMKGMEEAVSRLIRAIQNSEKILVYGDYDVDGTVATSILLNFFRELGVAVDYYIPHRVREGYSLNSQALEEISKRGVKVVITVDNGISSHENVALAKKLGIDLIVTDHHEVPPNLPDAFVILNPLQPGCEFPDKKICGSGVAFYLALGLRHQLRATHWFAGRNEPDLKKYTDLVALATVADVVPLRGVNRILVKAGLVQMGQTVWPGLQALIDISGVVPPFVPSHFGFRLGPRINAGGRLYAADVGVALLTSQNPAECQKLARELDVANRERQAVEVEILEEALVMLDSDPKASDRFIHVLYSEKWHVGVIGIVASRIVERTSRPVILLARDGDRLKGSARSFGGVNLVEMLRRCANDLLHFGGHKAAAGLALSIDRLESFREKIEKAISSEHTREDFNPTLNVDTTLSIAEINDRIWEEVEKLGPFGMGNPEPTFCVEGISIEAPRVVGEAHLKFKVSHQGASIPAIAFGMAKREEWDGICSLAYNIKKNFFQGRSTLEIQVKSLKKYIPH